MCKLKEFFQEEEKLWSARGRCFKSANKRRKDFCLLQIEDILSFGVITACICEE